MIIIGMLLLLLGTVDGRAEPVTLLDNHIDVQPEADKVVPVEAMIPKEKVDLEFEKMKAFMKEENERIKAIKMLNLDLERADLELKKREVEIKLADLNRGQESVQTLTSADHQPLYKIAGIFSNGEMREATLLVNGIRHQVHEGDKLNTGISIRSITANDVEVLYPDGKTEKLGFGS